MALTQRAIEQETTPGRYLDKNGLFLTVTATGSKSWLLRYQLNGKRRDAGLGAFPLVSLAAARKAALEMRVLIQKGIDPLDLKRKVVKNGATFESETLAFIERHRLGWSAKHAAQWLNSMQAHAFPSIGSMPIEEVDTDAVVKTLDPIWIKNPETARRVRNRMERVLDFSKTRGNRDGDNPARWRGHLQNLLSRVMDMTVPLESMPYYALPEFMGRLEGDNSRAARCLQFLILTAARSAEAMDAKWDEIDFETQTWTIPAERMKNSVMHQVPLSEQALEILRDAHTRGRSNYIFPNRSLKKPLPNNALRRLLVKYDVNATVHGFRATFRMWAAEKTKFSHDICELALSHTVGNATSRAYNRGNQLENRRALMDRWSKYATRAAGPSSHLAALATPEMQPTTSRSIAKP